MYWNGQHVHLDFPKMLQKNLNKLFSQASINPLLVCIFLYLYLCISLYTLVYVLNV